MKLQNIVAEENLRFFFVSHLVLLTENRLACAPVGPNRQAM